MVDLNEFFHKLADQYDGFKAEILEEKDGELIVQFTKDEFQGVNCFSCGSEYQPYDGEPPEEKNDKCGHAHFREIRQAWLAALKSERFENLLARNRCKLSKVLLYTTKDSVELIGIEDLSEEKPTKILVSPVVSAVLAIILRK